MRSVHQFGVLYFAALASAVGAMAEGPAITALSPAVNSADVPEWSSPAQLAASRAEAALATDGATADEYLALGVAQSRRARETANPVWYDRSDESLSEGLKLAPEHFAIQRQQVWNQLGRHEFAKALESARALHSRAKDDIATYGLIVDACVELGLYDEAEAAAQWMLDLRPGTPSAMSRVSYLREQFGDLRGAKDAMEMAFYSTRPSEFEARAWMLTHLAHLDLEEGKAGRAQRNAEAALDLFPNYHYALRVLALAHGVQGDHERSVTLMRQRYAIAPHPENLYDVAVALKAAGKAKEAIGLFAEFEVAALEESKGVDNANLELITFWLDVDPSPARLESALALAEARAAHRQDVATLETLAWARFQSGQNEGAWASMEAALAIGSRNARLRYRAGVIAASLGLEAESKSCFEDAWSTAPSTQWGSAARTALMSGD